MGPAPQVLAGAAPALLTKSVALPTSIGLPGAKAGISHYRDRIYARLAMPDLTALIGELRRDLLISEQTPALSLAAGVAVQSAVIGDCLAVGGQIQNVHLEGLIARFATLPDVAWCLVPLGPLPPERMESEMLHHVVVRLDVLPQWLAHRYFFLEDL